MIIRIQEIVEAAVITDKASGKSKGYGFVTFETVESAMAATANPAPMIDGRKANCNIAAFGKIKSSESTSKASKARMRSSSGASNRGQHKRQSQTTTAAAAVSLMTPQQMGDADTWSEEVSAQEEDLDIAKLLEHDESRAGGTMRYL